MSASPTSPQSLQNDNTTPLTAEVPLFGDEIAGLGPRELRKLAARLKTELDEIGVATLKSAIPPQTLQRMRDFALQQTEYTGKNTCKTVWREQLDGTIFAEICVSDFIKTISNHLVEHLHCRPIGDDDVWAGLRIMVSESHPHFRTYHFDAALVTAIIPVFLPDKSCSEPGDFVCYPNIRKVKPGLLERALHSVVRRFGLAPLLYKKLVVPLEIGNIYFFWGCRTFHMNGSVGPNANRTVCILNIGELQRGAITGELQRATGINY
jgi:hypothetical protein